MDRGKQVRGEMTGGNHGDQMDKNAFVLVKVC